MNPIIALIQLVIGTALVAYLIMAVIAWSDDSLRFGPHLRSHLRFPLTYIGILPLPDYAQRDGMMVHSPLMDGYSMVVIRPNTHSEVLVRATAMTYLGALIKAQEQYRWDYIVHNNPKDGSSE